MPLKFTDHRGPAELEEELRGLWRVVDLLRAVPATEPALPPAAPQPIEATVRTWTMPLDDARTYTLGPAEQRHTDVVISTAPAITHLGLWLAVEKCHIADAVYRISVAAYPGVKSIVAGGSDILWRRPSLTARDGLLFFERGLASFYEFELRRLADPYTEQVIPSVPAGQPWGRGDLAFFPVAFVGGGGQVRVTESVGVTHPSVPVCVRGYLTGHYLEHAEAPEGVWQCAAP